jgi:hypothetical protein
MNFTVNETPHSPSAKIEIKKDTSPVTSGFDVQHHKRNNLRTLDNANQTRHAELEEFKNFEATVLSGDDGPPHDEERSKAEGPAFSPKKTKNEVVTKVVDLAEEDYEAVEFDCRPRAQANISSIVYSKSLLK